MSFSRENEKGDENEGDGAQKSGANGARTGKLREREREK